MCANATFAPEGAKVAFFVRSARLDYLQNFRPRRSSSMRMALPSAKNVGAHSPTKMPQRSARSVLSVFFEVSQERNDRPIEAIPAANMWSEVRPISRSFVSMFVPPSSFGLRRRPVGFPLLAARKRRITAVAPFGCRSGIPPGFSSRFRSASRPR